MPAIQYLTPYQEASVAEASAHLNNAGLPTVEQMMEAIRKAHPWLILLGDHIGNGTPENPMGRCEAVLALHNIIAAVPPHAPTLKPGQEGTTSGFPATVVRHYEGRMYEVRVPGGVVCIDVGDFIPSKE